MSFLASMLKMLPDAAAQGLIWGILAIGVFITYKLLDFSDLTVDGSICTGGAVFVVWGSLTVDDCRFSNCTHQNEPGCAVKSALRSGELTAERLTSYQKLIQENAYAADSESYLASKEKKFKEIAKSNKHNKKK